MLVCAQACVHTCVLSSQESHCAFFFPPLKPWQQPVSVLLSVRDLFELCTWMHLCVYVYAELWVHTNYLCTHQSVSVCHAFHSLSLVALFAVLSTRPTWPRAAICFFPIINSTFSVTTDYGLSDPWLLTLPSLCLLHVKHGVKTESDPHCLFIFSSYCKWSHASPPELPSIQHLGRELLSMLKWIWLIRASYHIMVKETDMAVEMEAVGNC